MNPPTPLTEIELECPTCSSKGCSSCKHTGKFTITECPHKMLGREPCDRASIGEAVRLARMADKGAWPVGGGVLDQAQSFRDFCEHYWNDIDAMKPRQPTPLSEG